MKNSKILLVLLLIIGIIALSGCARYNGNPTRYDNNATPRGGVVNDYNRTNDRLTDRVNDNRLDHNRTDNRTNDNIYRNNNTNGAINNNR